MLTSLKTRLPSEIPQLKISHPLVVHGRCKKHLINDKSPSFYRNAICSIHVLPQKTLTKKTKSYKINSQQFSMPPAPPPERPHFQLPGAVAIDVSPSPAEANIPGAPGGSAHGIVQEVLRILQVKVLLRHVFSINELIRYCWSRTFHCNSAKWPKTSLEIGFNSMFDTET